MLNGPFIRNAYTEYFVSLQQITLRKPENTSREVCKLEFVEYVNIMFGVGQFYQSAHIFLLHCKEKILNRRK